MNFNISFNKYIKKTIYPDLSRHNFPNKKQYHYFIVIPVFNEFDYLLATLQSINNQDQSLLKKTLIVLVINNCKDSEQSIKDNNRLTFEMVQNKKFNYEYIILDYYSIGNELPINKSGVGVARKIGMDYCLAYSYASSLLFCLDADTLIAKSYLTKIVNHYNQVSFGTCIVKFSHQKSSNSKIEKAIRVYENILYKIANKIKACNSPYGYVSMGSTIICNVKSYIAVGGMPQKSAAEDFYFLQALAKYSSINVLNEYLVYPSTRLEMRVYLGTGFRMLQYNENENFSDLNFSDYCFDTVKKIIELVDLNYKISDSLFFKELNKNFDDKICNFLNDHNLKKIWNRINNNARSKKQFMIFFHQWFDALKIMQLLKILHNTKV
ncbi:MAG: hypothetical protein CMG50_02630 [Candidatus Marinimicrobia bacterium]|nr:hypothetical protein [Candidatus Neomarinimicrobiota bacterium]|tara:strand:+ start:31211 stop:32350 length:1140 start_codon:yes stop_codon:yes gene_type:complete